MKPPRKDDRLAGKVAIVTGAGSRTEGIGNGRATATLLARHGARVTLVDASRRAAEETARMIEDEGGECDVLEADVADAEACKSIVARTIDRWERLDVLVNNVGVTGPAGTALEVDPDAWDAGMRTNVTSMVLMSRHAVPEMRKLGAGSIVNIFSAAALRGGHPSLLYPTSKGAIISMTRAMAAHHGHDGIRVNCVAPGMVYTPMVASRGMTAEMREVRRERTLLGTEGTGWDVGYSVLFLAGDEARWITGIVPEVDGGAGAGSPRPATPRSDGRGE
jgi:NAD(P)-dependent dehydrogenase (short-subunit alcohol dehydrogenase family)